MPVPSPAPYRDKKSASQYLADYLPAVLLAFLMIGLTYQAGFYDDDAVISIWHQEMTRSGESLWSYCLRDFLNFIHFQGRFPLVFSFGLLPALIWIGDSVELYRAYFALIYLASFLVSQYGLAKLFGGHRPATVVLVCFVAGVQLQNYHDPYTSYFGYLPVLAAFIIGALASFDRLLDSRTSQSSNRKLLAFHLFWVTAAMLTWEIAIVIAAATAVQVLVSVRSWREKIRWLLVPCSWGAFFVVINLLLKRGSTNTGTLVEVSSPAKILQAYAVQLSSTVPFAAGDAYCPSIRQAFPKLGVESLLGTLLISFLLFKLIRTNREHHAPQSARPLRVSILLLTSLCLLFIPPFLPALTAKYQNELHYGTGYLQRYIQNLGLAMAVGVVLLWLSAKRRLVPALGTWAIGIGIATTFLLHNARNVEVIETRNAYWRAPRELAAAALQASGSPQGVIGIIVDRNYLQRWETVDFSQRHLGTPAPFKLHQEYVSGPDDRHWLMLGYTRFASKTTPAFAYVGTVAGPEYSTNNTLAVLRPLHLAINLLLEYAIQAPDGHVEQRTVPVLPVQSGQSVVFTLSEPQPIQRGSVRLVIKL